MKNEEIRSLNDVADRIKWTRKKLGLNTTEAAREMNMPASNYYGREQGVRTYYFEDYLTISEYFNQKWREMFKDNFPSYRGNEVRKIHVLWIMFGIRGDL